ncbi:protein regulator of cytokinesis 1-like isoform X1 [Rhynchophorus ferrugineus]|uniref:protein regulator of cytokinesis 1-like isoform X1 n=1 Tax=Rhynchophorus ferrugineus TaxID=354439 RepID=UPI003FCDE402
MESDYEKLSDQLTMDALEELDLNVIEHLPWAQDLWLKIQLHTKKGFLNWCKIVEKLTGTNAEPVKEWANDYLKVIDETCIDLVIDIDALHTNTIDKIQNLLSKLQKLCIELHQKMPPKIGQDKLSLFEERERLKKRIQECEEIINAKKKEIKILTDKQTKYCNYLGEEPKFNLPCPPLPTPQQMEEFQKYIDKLEHEKFEREERYCMLKEDIMKLVEDLRYKPNSDFEHRVLSSDNISVTNENMSKLELFSKNLVEVKRSTDDEVSHLRNKVEELWKMLEIDLVDRDEFRTHYTGSSLRTLDALRVEVKRCDEIRKANIKVFIDKLRRELEDIWRKCHRVNEAKSFPYFNSDCYTEDLLDLHDIELQKWKCYYEENCKLLGLLEKHKELWEKVIQLEDNTSGPNRYKNRGGKLLQEEKERNKLSKMIPKIEEEILALSEEYKNNNGYSLMTFGITPEEYINNMYTERENTKKLKLSARKQQRDTTAVGVMKSAISLFPSTSTAVTPTLLSATKRKILGTPASENKRQKLGTPRSLFKPKRTPGTVPKIKVTHPTLTLPSQKRRSRTSMERRRRRRSGRNKGVNATVMNQSKNTTYSEFQNDLSNRGGCRSTILPDDMVMKTPAAQSRLKTPSKSPTPFKTPLSHTPTSARKGNSTSKFSACKTNLKLLF